MTFVIGLTGGIASGKSSACVHLLSLESGLFNIAKIDADKLGHRAYEVGTPCYESIVAHFGKDKIVADDDTINRKALGAIVFGDPSQMRALEAIVWPAIRSMIEAELTVLRDSEDNKKPTICILEAAVMLEASWHHLCDSLWVTYVDPSVAKQRLMCRNSLTSEEADKRISSQMTNEERFSKLSAMAVDTNNSIKSIPTYFLLDNNCTTEEFKLLISEKFHETMASSNPIFRFLSPLITKARADSFDDSKPPQSNTSSATSSSKAIDANVDVNQSSSTRVVNVTTVGTSSRTVTDDIAGIDIPAVERSPGKSQQNSTKTKL